MNLIPLSNHILYLPYWDKGEQVDIGGIKSYVDPRYNPGMHQPVHGKVLAVPPFLEYTSDVPTLDWDTDMELKPGDEVLCNYFEVFQASRGSTRKKIDVDGQTALLIRYDKVYAARREGVILPVNGYVFVEAKDSEPDNKHEDPSSRKFDYDRRFGVVRYVGNRLRDYRYDPYAVDDFDPVVGETYAFDNASDVVSEHDLHRDFFDKRMFRMQRKEIIGHING